MDYRQNQQEMDNKEKYYEHLTYPNLGNEGMSPLVKEYTSMLPQYQNIYLYGTPGHFGTEHQYNSPVQSDNPFIHERAGRIYPRPHYYGNYYGYYNYSPYYSPLYYDPYFNRSIFFPFFLLSKLFQGDGWYYPY